MKKLTLASLAATLALLGISSCGKEPGYVFWEPLREDGRVDSQVFVRELTQPTIDILWVIDNSGSMVEEQAAVIANTQIFMDEFVKYQLNWKMGLISTALAEQPYIGFTPTTLLDSNTPDAVKKFQDAVARLGTGGDGTERTFEPLLKALTANPDFNRPLTPLAVIMVTDAEEQSNMAFSAFMPQLRQLLGTRNVFAYGVFNANDLGPSCNGEDGSSWNYAGSPYEQFIQAAEAGGVYPMCVPNFGQQLSAVGNQIARRVARPAIYLPHRPKVASIRVTYGNQVLPAGFESDGGYWLYDVGDNAVVFHNLDFATNPNDKVGLTYEKDDGYPISGDIRRILPQKGAKNLDSAGVLKEDGWMEFGITIESPHPYASYSKLAFPIGMEDAVAVKFYFDYVDTESSYDFVSIYSKARQQVANYTGKKEGFWSPEIPGDRASIQFTSDSSDERTGFKISKVAFKFAEPQP